MRRKFKNLEAADVAAKMPFALVVSDENGKLSVHLFTTGTERMDFMDNLPEGYAVHATTAIA